jgi:hypothetical protein
MNPQTKKSENSKKKLDNKIKTKVNEDLDSILSGSRMELSKPAERYYKSLIDPRSANASRLPSLMGGYVESSAARHYKCRTTATVGTGGFGFAFAMPTTCGPVSGRVAMVSTTAIYAGTAPSGFPTAVGAGEQVSEWVDAEFTAASNVPALDAVYRTVSAAVYITPTSGMTTAGGTIHLLEMPGHISGTFSLGEAQSHPRTRTIRGLQAGDPRDLNVLNWHPAGSSTVITFTNQITNAVNDFQFRGLPQGANLSVCSANELLIVFAGAAGQTYDIELHAVYELVGKKVKGQKRAYYDSRGMDLVLNGLGAKNISGWVGTPSEAERAYSHAMVHAADQAGQLVSSASRAYKQVKESSLFSDLKNIATSVAGFLL